MDEEGIEGCTPYGYRREGRKVVEDPGEQEVIKQLIRLRQVEKLSYDDIAEWCNARFIPPRRGTKWWDSSIRRIIFKVLKKDLDGDEW